MRRRSSTSSTAAAHWMMPFADFDRGSVRPRPHLKRKKRITFWEPKESEFSYRSIVISRKPIHCAISSYKPIIWRTQPRPRKTTTGKPLALPRSDRLTVKGLSADACGDRVSFRSVVSLAERKYCATACEAEGLAIVRKFVSHGEDGK